MASFDRVATVGDLDNAIDKIRLLNRELIFQKLDDRRLLSSKLAADYLGISLRMLDGLCAEKRLKPIRIGRKRLFDTRSLDAFIRNCAD